MSASLAARAGEPLATAWVRWRSCVWSVCQLGEGPIDFGGGWFQGGGGVSAVESVDVVGDAAARGVASESQVRVMGAGGEGAVAAGVLSGPSDMGVLRGAGGWE